jgi:hypothetical protein
VNGVTGETQWDMPFEFIPVRLARHRRARTIIGRVPRIERSNVIVCGALPSWRHVMALWIVLLLTLPSLAPPRSHQVVREEAYSTPQSQFIKHMLSPKRSRGPRNFYGSEVHG